MVGQRRARRVGAEKERMSRAEPVGSRASGQIAGAIAPVSSVLVIALATLAIAMDGFAGQILPLSVPAMMKTWQVSRAAFAPATAATLFAMSLGAVAAGWIGDRIGRKRSLMISMIIFAVVTLLTATTDDLVLLTALRAVAGLGLGGAIPNASSLVAEYTAPHRRVMGVTTANLGIPLGGLVAGLVGAWVLPVYGWRPLFAIGGAIPIAAAVAIAAFMPESAGGRRGRTASVQPPRAETRWGYLLARPQIGDTLMLSLAFFFTFLAIYAVVNWLPAFLAARGYRVALTSTGLAAFNLGGVAGALLVGGLVARFGSRAPMLGMAAVAAVCATGLAISQAAIPGGALALILILAIDGAMISGVQATLFALGAHVFPAELRASGLGLALGVGRVGAVVSAFAGASTFGLPPAVSFFGTVALAMAASAICLGRIQRHIPKTRTSGAGPRGV